MPREAFIWHGVTVDEGGVVTEGRSPFDFKEADNEVWVTIEIDGKRHVEHCTHAWTISPVMGFKFVGVDNPQDIVAWAFNNPPPPYRGVK